MTRAVQAGVTWAPMPEEMERGQDAAVEQATSRFVEWLQCVLVALKSHKSVLRRNMLVGACEQRGCEMVQSHCVSHSFISLLSVLESTRETSLLYSTGGEEQSGNGTEKKQAILCSTRW